MDHSECESAYGSGYDSASEKEHIYDEPYVKKKNEDEKEHIYDEVASGPPVPPGTHSPMMPRRNTTPIQQQKPDNATDVIRDQATNVEKIENVRPTPKKEAIQPVKLVDEALEELADRAHQHIPGIANLNLIECLTRIQNSINTIVYMRTEDNDNILTEKQKEKLRNIKLKIKQDTPLYFMTVTFYEKIDALIKKFHTPEEKYLKERLREAKSIKMSILKMEKEANDLLYQIKPDYNHRSTAVPSGIHVVVKI